jgi:hypothetical protein
MKAAQGLLVAAFVCFVFRFSTVAQTITIEPTVQVTFDTATNRFYQVEAASAAEPDRWEPVGLTRWGYGFAVEQTLPITHSAQFIRTREFDLTNGLVARFALDGSTRVDSNQANNKVYATQYAESRFHTPNHAGLNANNPGVYASVNSYVQGTSDFTISIWFAPFLSVPTTNFIGYILAMDRKLALLSTNNAIQLYYTGVSGPVLSSGPMIWENSRWYNLQLARSNRVYRVYLDAKLVGEGMPSKTTTPFWDYYDISLGPYPGVVDEVRLYNRALPIEEIGAVYRLAEQ